jgi:hypothetical protein
MLQENTGTGRRSIRAILAGLFVLTGAAATLSGPAVAESTRTAHHRHHQAYRNPSHNYNDYYSYYGARPSSDTSFEMPNGEVNIPYRLSR